MEIKEKDGDLVIFGETKSGKEAIIRKIVKSKDRVFSSEKPKQAIKKIKVKKINVIANEDVYDVAVEGNRNFFANNVYSASKARYNGTRDKRQRRFLWDISRQAAHEQR
jgi:intein/homing endonuclease